MQRVAVWTTEQRPYINSYMMYLVMLSPPPASSQTFRRQLTLALQDGIPVLREEQNKQLA